MLRKLSADQVARYERDGFVLSAPALTRAEADGLRVRLEAFEAAIGGPLTSPAHSRYRFRTHVLLTWVNDLARHPAILDAVEGLIGPDILVYTTSWFIKEAHSEAIAAWHQDATYFGLSPHRHVTAWVALTDATAANGCMEFLPGSHLRGQLPHRAGAVANSVNGAGQTVDLDVDDGTAVHAPLEAGRFSLHHTLCLHRSKPNRTATRRVGLAISYVPAHVRHTSQKHRAPAMLVRGADAFGHFELEPAPAGDLAPAAHEAYARAYDLYRAAYGEQVALMGS